MKATPRLGLAVVRKDTRFALLGTLLTVALACQSTPIPGPVPSAVPATATVDTTPTGAGIVTAQPSSNCQGALPPRLRVGENGRVTFTDGKPLRVHEQPSRSAAVIERIPEGTQFQVVDAPVCADGWYWWKISAGNTGWASEGSPEDGYFPEPYQQSDGGPTATTAEPTPTAVYTGPPLQPVQWQQGQNLPPDVFEQMSFAIGGGGTDIYICNLEFNVPILAVGDAEGGYRQFSNGEVADTTSLLEPPLLGWNRLRDLPGLCLGDPTLANMAVAISPTGARVQPYVEPSNDETKKRVYLPLEAFIQPGLWHLVIDAPSQHFELGIQIPQTNEPNILAYNTSQELLVGFDPNECIIAIAFDSRGFVGTFDFQTDSHGFAMIALPALHSRVVYYAFIGENGHVICDSCKAGEDIAIYDYYWSSGTHPEGDLTSYSWLPKITDVRFCDAPAAVRLRINCPRFPKQPERFMFNGMLPT